MPPVTPPPVTATPEQIEQARNDTLLPPELMRELGGVRIKTNNPKWRLTIGEDDRPGVIKIYLGKQLRVTRLTPETAIAYLRSIKERPIPKPRAKKKG